MKQVVLGLRGSRISQLNGKGSPGSLINRTATTVNGPDWKQHSAFAQEVVNTPDPMVIVSMALQMFCKVSSYFSDSIYIFNYKE